MADHVETFGHDLRSVDRAEHAPPRLAAIETDHLRLVEERHGTSPRFVVRPSSRAAGGERRGDERSGAHWGDGGEMQLGSVPPSPADRSDHVDGDLQELNRVLDRRVAERTRELELKNQALTASEQRFRTLVEGMPQLVWRSGSGGRWTWASPQWEEYTGYSSAASAGLGWLDAIHPEDRDGVMAAWRHADAGAPLTFEARIVHAAERRHRHFQVRGSAVRDGQGTAIEWLGTSTDVDDIVRLQRRQQWLVGELQHRTRNILTVVRSVFGRTMDAGGEAEDLADHFRGRLDSLARTQVVASASTSGLVDLEDLIRDELMSVGVGDGPTLVLDGPDVALSPKAAESLGLAFHELTTNALKFGALRDTGGSLTITWHLRTLDSGVRLLDLRWTERGVPAVDLAPARRGFGTELIIEALPYRLGAETRLEFLGGGVRCTICVPLPDADGAWR